MGKQKRKGGSMSINIGGGELRELKPRILVLGVGGAGGNAINAMIESGMTGVEFVAVNTDAQDLKLNKADAKIQIGMNLTKGLGAGAKHDIGQAAADESLNEIVSYLQGTTLVGMLPVPHPIVIRKFQPNQYTKLWFSTFMWGVIYLQNQHIPIWDGKRIILFGVDM